MNDHSLTSSLLEVMKSVEHQVIGQSALVEELFCCLLAEGHLLVTGVPGLAKTTLIRVVSESLDLSTKRVQFTPDLLPFDIIGSEIFDAEKKAFRFIEGPLFCNLLLADEINRASPKTQSALLEAMQERTVSVAGKTMTLSRPFMVFATQNPMESEGTFPLPEAQLDRFLLSSTVTYPEPAQELLMLKMKRDAGEGKSVERVSLTADQLKSLQKSVSEIVISDAILELVRDIVVETRPEHTTSDKIRKYVAFGCGPRAGLAIMATARAYALIKGQSEVRWSHILRILKPALRHRFKLQRSALIDRIEVDQLIEEVEAKVRSKSSLNLDV